MRAAAVRQARRAAIAAAAMLAVVAGPAQALSFSEAYAAARGFDAQYRAASHELDSARQLVPINRAALLPAVGMSLSRMEYNGTRTFPNSANQEVTVATNYTSPQASVTLRLPLLNAEATKRYEQARVQADIGESVYRARGMELVDRLGTAYLQVLLSNDNAGYAETLLRAAQAQAAKAEQRFKRGEGTRTDVAMAQASVDQARVRVIETKDQQVLAQRGFKRVTGAEPVALNQLVADFVPGELEPGRLGDWLALAIDRSPQLQVRQQSMVAARLAVDRQTAGHYPRVDLVANLSRNTNETITTLNQTSVLSSLGVQVSVPLYNGGGIEAGVKQALADQARVEEEMKNERESIELEVQRQFLAVSNGAVRITAYKRAAQSSEVALLGASRALDNGLGTIADVLDAQARLDSARRDLAQARYDYLLARLRLQAASGAPMDELVADIDRLLPVAAAPANAAVNAPVKP